MDTGIFFQNYYYDVVKSVLLCPESVFKGVKATIAELRDDSSLLFIRAETKFWDTQLQEPFEIQVLRYNNIAHSLLILCTRCVLHHIMLQHLHTCIQASTINDPYQPMIAIEHVHILACDFVNQLARENSLLVLQLCSQGLSGEDA